jgi:hypothetical protein
VKKKIVRNQAHYTVAWSRTVPFDKYSVSRIVPELPGIVFFSRKENCRVPLFIFGCWREGLRLGIKYLFDPKYSKVPHIAHALLDDKLFFKFAVLDSDPRDMKDVMALLISKYAPVLNNKSYADTGRYAVIHLREVEMKDGEVVEKIPRSGF